MRGTDADLVQRALAGSQDAFGALVERHRRLIFAYALQRGLRAAEADDAAQEVFLKAYERLDTLADPAAFARWLYGIAAHVVADGLRRRARQRAFRGHHNDAWCPRRAAEPVVAADPFADEVRREECRAVFRALDELPEEQRLVILLRYVDGLTPKEVAERLGEPRGTIRSRLHYALAGLQAALGAAPGAHAAVRGGHV